MNLQEILNVVMFVCGNLTEGLGFLEFRRVLVLVALECLQSSTGMDGIWFLVRHIPQHLCNDCPTSFRYCLRIIVVSVSGTISILTENNNNNNKNKKKNKIKH